MRYVKPTKEEFEEKILKLPRWVRNAVASLQNTVTSLRRDLDTLRCKHETDAYWESYGHGDDVLPKKMYLPGGRATFVLGKDKFGRNHSIDVVIETTIDGVKAIGIRAYHSGLRVYPSASNCVTLTTLPSEN
jgi:hypothetical protein